ncbi:GH92 family glycosyl hydrolase [Pendulispora rubella]|uniref:GH92 family glycosyl hydrolase n=1 Tax=Pendulispora rubella TaxID=2741070 RepID=A0ABZ2LBW8_9BACT
MKVLRNGAPAALLAFSTSLGTSFFACSDSSDSPSGNPPDGSSYDAGPDGTSPTADGGEGGAAVDGGDAGPLEHYERLVNTFIGTKDDGNTFPGASAPFGMTQVSPIGAHYAGYLYNNTAIKGFGHFFISGAGCWEQGGQVSVLPTVGTIGPNGSDFDVSSPTTFDHSKYGAEYTHDGEVGQAGYFKIRLTKYGGIDAENTALTHATAERYTFGSGAQGNVFVNVGQATDKHNVMASSITVVDDHTLEGYVDTQSFCGGKRYKTYFQIKANRPFKAQGTWSPAGGDANSKHSEGDQGLRGAWITFDTAIDKAVTLTTAISHVDVEGARKNLNAEGMSGGYLKSFDAVRQESQAAWQTELARVKVDGGSTDQRTVFYTALYHALLQPLTGNDVDGRYLGWDNAIHTASGFTYYEFFSLWDTFRSQNQFLALLLPSRARDIGKSILAIHDQGGWLPRWAYANFETNCMTGDPVTAFMADLWRYGVLQGEEEHAYQAMLQNAEQLPPAESRSQGRAGNTTYIPKGFAFYDKNFVKKGQDADPQHGGSATLEYAVSDCALSAMASELNHADDAARLQKRGQNWTAVWDDAVEDNDHGGAFKGFPRPRTQDGNFYTPPDKPYTPTSEDGFHEGTAWQYQWLVPQDANGLAAKMGGREQATKRLDIFFAYDDLLANPAKAAREKWVVGPYAYYNQYRYNPNNEPDLHSAFMYAVLGRPDKTAVVLDAAQTLFTNAPNGVTGNDDLGTMSAWYLFDVMGLYPFMPGSGNFLVHPPRFARVDVQLENGRHLVLNAPGAGFDKVRFIDEVRVGGELLDEVYVPVSKLQSGQVIDYTLTDEVDADGWGTSPEAAPPSMCPVTK